MRPAVPFPDAWEGRDEGEWLLASGEGEQFNALMEARFRAERHGEDEPDPFGPVGIAAGTVLFNARWGGPYPPERAERCSER